MLCFCGSQISQNRAELGNCFYRRCLTPVYKICESTPRRKMFLPIIAFEF